MTALTFDEINDVTDQVWEALVLLDDCADIPTARESMASELSRVDRIAWAEGVRDYEWKTIRALACNSRPANSAIGSGFSSKGSAWEDRILARQEREVCG